jgi:hypothetical protein
MADFSSNPPTRNAVKDIADKTEVKDKEELPEVIDKWLQAVFDNNQIDARLQRYRLTMRGI